MRLFKDSLFCILLLVLTRTVTRESVIMCIQCARSNPNQPCRLEKSQQEQVLPARKRKHEHGHEDVEQGGGQARLPWKEAIRQAAMEEDHERDVMLQPKRSTWDSYVPSKSKTKVVSGGPEDPLLQGWPWSQAIRSMEGLKEEEEKKKLKEKEDKMAKLVKIVEMDKFTEEKTRYKN